MSEKEDKEGHPTQHPTQKQAAPPPVPSPVGLLFLHIFLTL